MRKFICVSMMAMAGLGFSSLAHSTEKRVVAAIDPVLSDPLRQNRPPAAFFTINEILAMHDGRADGVKPLRVALTSSNVVNDAPLSSLPSSSRTDEPFGLMTFRAPEGLLWVKWRAVADEISSDQKVLAQCEADRKQCPSPAALRFLMLVDKAREMPTRLAIETINRSINLAIRYVSDQRQHAVPDLWSAPLATFANGQGDCEDYAIAKYVALRQLGVSAEDLRLLLVRDRGAHQDHAVLGVRHQNRWLVLDNRQSTLPESTELQHFTPLFAIDHDGVKLFAASYPPAKPQGGFEMAPAAASAHE
jgi:predicted transglutaminase-like cysteine proteinase